MHGILCAEAGAKTRLCDTYTDYSGLPIRTVLDAGGTELRDNPNCEALAKAEAQVIIASRHEAHCAASVEALKQRGLKGSPDQFDEGGEPFILHYPRKNLKSLGKFLDAAKNLTYIGGVWRACLIPFGRPIGIGEGDSIAKY